MIHSIKYIYLILLTIFISCNNQNDDIPRTENEIFNNLLEGSSSTTINLDEIKIDTILVDEKNKLGTRISKKFTEPVYLGFPTNSFISLNDSLYVASKQRIYVMDDKGKWQRTVGRKGRGPGEFDSFVKIENNDKYIYAFDYGSSRIHKYDYKLNLVSSVKLLFDYSPLWKSFAFSDSRLYLKSNLNPNDDLISIYDLEDMEGEIETFWPKSFQAAFNLMPITRYLLMLIKTNALLLLTWAPHIYLWSIQRIKELKM